MALITYSRGFLGCRNHDGGNYSYAVQRRERECALYRLHVTFVIRDPCYLITSKEILLQSWLPRRHGTCRQAEYVHAQVRMLYLYIHTCHPVRSSFFSHKYWYYRRSRALFEKRV